MIEEIFRVLKPGGRIAISDIVSDEPIPRHLKEDKLLWSGCISGAFEEHAMLEEFREFDRKMIHEKYESVVEELKADSGI